MSSKYVYDGFIKAIFDASGKNVLPYQRIHRTDSDINPVWKRVNKDAGGTYAVTELSQSYAIGAPGLFQITEAFGPDREALLQRLAAAWGREVVDGRIKVQL